MAATLTQSRKTQSLLPSILNGLRSEQKTSPSLLLWDDEGLSLYDVVLEAPEYYPSIREWVLLRNVAQRIASKFTSGDRLMELGAG
jgi:uncharacterized SAM-dependent methyltransferase